MKKAEVPPLAFFFSRMGRFWGEITSGHAGVALAMLGRYIILPFMAFAIVVILVSDDALLRLVALICLIFLEQIRDIWTFREIIGKKTG